MTYDSSENALEAMDALRTLNKSKNLNFLAQLWPGRNHVPPNHPRGPVLAVSLGFQGALEDVHRLFQDWSQETKPIGIRLGGPMFGICPRSIIDP